VDAFEQALELEPDNKRAIYGIALAHLMDGDEEAAVEQYVKLDTIDPEMAKDLYLKILERRR
jgi:cytochrome c-type biogenesis protein CcmH/NrfG